MKDDARRTWYCWQYYDQLDGWQPIVAKIVGFSAGQEVVPALFTTDIDLAYGRYRRHALAFALGGEWNIRLVEMQEVQILGKT